MEYPNLMSEGLTFDAAYTVPDFESLRLPGELTFPSLPRLDQANVALQVHMADEYGDFVSPPNGSAHMFQRLDRLGRLADGKYQVFVPETEVKVLGRPLRIPSRVIEYDHKRERHEVSEFDMESWMNPDSFDARWGIEKDEDVPGSRLKSVRNLALTGRDFSTVYSDFRAVVEEPEGWHEANEAFEEFEAGEKADYVKSRSSKIEEMLRNGRGVGKIVRDIGRDDQAFIEANEAVIRDYASRWADVNESTLDGLGRLINEYYGMLTHAPYVPIFSNGPSFLLDSKGRALNHSNLGGSRDLFSYDFANAIIRAVEVLPLNEGFHEELRDKLSRPGRKLKDYEKAAMSILTQAYALRRDGHSSAAIGRAQTALEVVLRGFVGERGQLEAGEPVTFRQLIGGFFDRAILSDPNYSGRRRNIFDPTIRERLASSSSGNGDTPSITEIRNAEFHEGGSAKINASRYGVVSVGLNAYSEAINYVINSGWMREGAPSLDSEVLTWMLPNLTGYVPAAVGDRPIHMLERSFDHFSRYLRPEEVKLIKGSIPRNSWASEKAKSL